MLLSYPAIPQRSRNLQVDKPAERNRECQFAGVIEASVGGYQVLVAGMNFAAPKSAIRVR